MNIGWVWFIPIALLNVILTAAGVALDAPWVAWALPVLLVGVGVGAVAFAWSRDRGSAAAGPVAGAAEASR
jgi:NADH-quinone oxidoreductase subunit H